MYNTIVYDTVIFIIIRGLPKLTVIPRNYDFETWWAPSNYGRYLSTTLITKRPKNGEVDWYETVI